jgi:LuxR family maltose regulon positive regulatory protein
VEEEHDRGSFAPLSVQFWLSGEVRTVYTWVFSLPDSPLRAHIPLALNATLRFVNSVNLSNEMLYVGMQIQVEHTFSRMDEILRIKRELSLSDIDKIDQKKKG